MMRIASGLVLGLASFVGLSIAASAQTYRPPVDLAALKGPRAGPPNQVMVLGTMHMRTLPDDFDPANVSLMIDRLAAWKPQAIMIEALSGTQCDEMRRYPQRYADTVAGYCPDVTQAAAATGLDVPAATMEASALLTAWPEHPTSGARRHLAAILLAAGDPGSALVQWLYLSPDERRAEDGLNDALVRRLEKLRVRRNETSLLSAPLAVRAGLQRLYPVDDHTGDSEVHDEAAYGKAIAAAWDNPVVKARRDKDKELTAAATTPAGIVAYYRWLNSPEMQRMVFPSDFGAALAEPSPQHFGRQYVGYWETRNLRIAANIRDVQQAHIGIRSLVVIGASHKLYLEDYLNQMHDEQLVDTEPLLR